METLIKVDGGEIWVEDSGVHNGGVDNGGVDNGPAVILLHPGWGDAGIWDDVIARLVGQPRVIRYDVRGYRNSPAPTGPFTALGDLIAVLDGLGVAQAVLVGHSGGGATATSLALTSPERVSSLILLAPGMDGYPWPEDDPFAHECGRLAQAGDVEGLVALGLRTWAAGGADAVAEAQVRSAIAGLFAQQDFLTPELGTFGRLEELSVPTQLLLGDLEYPMVRDCAVAAATRIPGCRLTMVQGADHMLPLRAPDLIAELIDAVTFRPQAD